MRSIVHTAIAQRELVDAAAKQTAIARRSKAAGVKCKVMMALGARFAVSIPANPYPLLLKIQNETGAIDFDAAEAGGVP